MIDLALKNIRYQKTRTFLTVLGIVIGIGAVVALGSISAGLNEEIQSSLELVAGKIIVTEAGANMMMGFTGSELTDEDVDEIADITGVDEVVPILYYYETLGFGGPEWVAIGLEPDKTEFFTGESILIEEGRNLEDGDYESAVFGKSLAEKFFLETGDFFTLNEVDVEVVGILERADISDVDNGMMIPLEALQDITEQDTYQMVYVVPEDVRDAEFVADRIKDSEEYDAITSTEMARQASEIVGQISVFTIGIGAVAALVGGLGIMNTMIMAVMERKREIGVMKAIGASRRKIMIHFLTESILISAIGGVVGILLGTIVSLLLGSILGFMSLASVTPGLVVGSLSFAVLLGLVGGAYPAWKAAKQDPVEALRYE